MKHNALCLRRCSNTGRVALVALVTALLLVVALPPAAAEEADAPTGPLFRTIADVGFGIVDEDGFILLLLEQDMAWGGLDVSLSGPLRFRVVDNRPNGHRALRDEDWDEPSDFARIVSRIQFAHSWENAALTINAGVLSAEGIGHGAVVDNYFNSTDVDHYQGGVVARFDYRRNGAEFLLDNVVAPEIAFGRLFAAPLSWFLKDAWAERLELGYTLGADFSAPRVDLPQRKDTILATTGLDLAFRVIDTERLVIQPYVEGFIMDGDGGFHVGLSSDWLISEEHEVSAQLRGEYRLSGPDYQPALFNPFYEKNRFAFQRIGPGQWRSFADSLADSPEAPMGHGLMLDFTLQWSEGLRVGARYDRTGDKRPHWVQFRVDVFPWEGYSVAAYYAGQDTRGGADLFSQDALIGLGLRAQIWGPVDVFSEYTRRFRRMDGHTRYVNEAAIGGGVSYTY